MRTARYSALECVRDPAQKAWLAGLIRERTAKIPPEKFRASFRSEATITHEIGHAAFLRRLGASVESMRVWLYGPADVWVGECIAHGWNVGAFDFRETPHRSLAFWGNKLAGIALETVIDPDASRYSSVDEQVFVEVGLASLAAHLGWVRHAARFTEAEQRVIWTMRETLRVAVLETIFGPEDGQKAVTDQLNTLELRLRREGRVKGVDRFLPPPTVDPSAWGEMVLERMRADAT